MQKRIVVGHKDESTGPLYLIDQIWRPENWRLVRGSALALHVDSDERVLVSGLGSNPPVGTVIDAGEIYSLYTYDEFRTARTSGLWQYTNRYDMGNIKAFFNKSDNLPTEAEVIEEDYRDYRHERLATKEPVVCLSGPFIAIKAGNLELKR